MRNLSIDDLAYLFADDWTIADVEAASDQEISTGVGIARMRITVEEGDLSAYSNMDELIQFQRDHEQAMDEARNRPREDADSNDEPF